MTGERRGPGGRNTCSVERKNVVGGRELRRLSTHHKAAANCVRRVQAIGAVRLDAIEEAAAKHIRCDPVEDKVADRIRFEMQGAVAGEIGDLQIGILELLLQSDHAVEALLELTLIERRGIKIGEPEDGKKLRRLSRIVGDLIFLDGVAGDRGQPRRVVEQGRDIAECSSLVAVIVDGIGLRRRVLETQDR